MSDTRLSMREQLMKSADEHGLKDEGGAPSGRVPSGADRTPEPVKATPSDKAAAPPAKAEAKTETKVEAKTEAKTETTGEKARDAAGKFTSKKFPGQFKKELQPAWDKPGGHTPEEWAAIQDEIHRRESEHSKGISEFQKKLSDVEPKYKAFEDALAPYRETFARRGIEPVSLIKQLIALGEYADRDWPGFITEQSRLRGFDLSSLIAQQQQDGRQTDPAVAALEKELNALKAHITGNQQQQQYRAQQDVASQVKTFAEAAAEDGSPKHPHFERVKTAMGHLMAANPMLTLADAYRDACYAVPEIRDGLLADEWTAREARRLEELKRAEDAAKSNRGNANGRVAQTGAPTGTSIRAQLMHQWDALNGPTRVQ